MRSWRLKRVEVTCPSHTQQLPLIGHCSREKEKEDTTKLKYLLRPTGKSAQIPTPRGQKHPEMDEVNLEG